VPPLFSSRTVRNENYRRFIVKKLFPLGSVYSTPGALAVCASFPMTPEVLLIRHVTGDWSDMSKDDQTANRRSVEDGSRIFSAYQYGDTVSSSSPRPGGA
jgi:hypothetical protein